MNFECYPNPYGFTIKIPHEPIPWKRPAQSGKHRYDSQKDLKAQLIPFFVKAMNNRPPFKGPISIIMVFWFKLPLNKKQGTPHTVKPDADNLAKMYLDTMTNAGVYLDDAQVNSLSLQKYYQYKDAEPYVYIALTANP